MKSTLQEDGEVPTNNVGSGQIAGLGVGPQGEPGVDMTQRRKKWKQDQQHSVPLDTIAEGQVPIDVELWAAAESMAQDQYPDYPTPESTAFAIRWYQDHGGEYGMLPTTESVEDNTPTEREWGSDSLVAIYKKDTPGELSEAVAFVELLSLAEAWEKITTCQQCKAKLSPRELKLGARVCDACVKKNKGKVWGKDSDDVYDEDIHRNDAYTSEDDDCGCGTPVKEALSVTEKPIGQSVHHLEEAEYQGRKVTLGKPFRTPSGPKKFSVYVTNDKGNVVKVNFGDPNMEIKRDDPDRRKAYRDRHNCDNPGPRWKAEYWSCRMWSTKPVSKIAEAKVDAMDEQTYDADACECVQCGCQSSVTEGAHKAVLIAVPKDPRGSDGRGYWKIGNEVYRASIKGATDVHGLPADKRWESSFTHFAHYWNSVHSQHYTKTAAFDKQH